MKLNRFRQVRRRLRAGFSARTGERGMSLLEVTVAGALVLVIAIGVLPMMVRSLNNNQLGWQSTEMSNHFRSLFDRSMEIPFAATDMTIPNGTNELVFDSFYTAGSLAQVQDANERWWDAADLGLVNTDVSRGSNTARGPVMWVRRTRVRQFNIDALGELQDPNNIPFPSTLALAGGTLDDLIHLKEVRIEMTRGNSQGFNDGNDRAPRYGIVLYKAF